MSHRSNSKGENEFAAGRPSPCAVALWIVANLTAWLLGPARPQVAIKAIDEDASCRE